MIVADRTGVPMEHITVRPRRHRRGALGRPHGRVALGADGWLGDRRRRPTRWSSRRASAPPACSRPPSTTSCSTSRPGGSTSPARRPATSAGPTSATNGDDPLAADTDFDCQRRHVPVRRPRRGGRGRHRDRRRPPDPPRRRRRRRHADQPAARRGPGARRHRPGRGAGAARADPLRRPTASRRPPTSPTTSSCRRPSCRRSRSSHMETPTWMNPLGAKGVGESGHDRRHPVGVQRGRRRGVGAGRATYGNAAHARAHLARPRMQQDERSAIRSTTFTSVFTSALTVRSGRFA